MELIKPKFRNYLEIFALICIYVLIICNVFVFKDSLVAAFSAFFGITYTFLAGKGTPKCYLFGVSGSGLYCWLSFANHFWGNLFLYLCYYIPMQIAGYFKWNKHLKENKQEIVKTKMSVKESLYLYSVTTALSIVLIIVLHVLNDKNPVIDGITTIFSIAGMYLTVKRCIEQWIVWMIVNSLSALMWGELALNGEKVYSTVLMWCVYFIMAIYFYFEWKKEVYKKV